MIATVAVYDNNDPNMQVVDLTVGQVEVNGKPVLQIDSDYFDTVTIEVEDGFIVLAYKFAGGKEARSVLAELGAPDGSGT